jgi:uncharacterized protein (TIGR02757 family)
VADRAIKQRLDALVEAYGPARLAGDPLSLVHRYDDPRDREVAGLVASGLAFGSATQIIRVAGGILDTLGPHPAEAIREPDRLIAIHGMRHRWVSGEDVADLLGAVAGLLAEHGSLEAIFREGWNPADGDVGTALSHFARRIRERGRTGTRGFRYLLPDSATGSAAKRLCLWLRWMVRPADGVDLGVWTGIPTSALLVPLDTHVLRIARYIGLTERRTASLATAREITKALARFDPDDPTRYDFALAQLGISKGCAHRRDPELCGRCPLETICVLD